MPLTPKQLYRQGLLSLKDQTSWPVQIMNGATQEVIGIMSHEEAKETLPEHLKLNINFMSSEPERLLNPESIKLDGREPKAPLTDEERMKIYKVFLGL